MNIFEDLIEELKEENLLEETVTEVQRNESERKKNKQQDQAGEPDLYQVESSVDEVVPVDIPTPTVISAELSPETGVSANAPYDLADFDEPNLNESSVIQNAELADSALTANEKTPTQTATDDFADENTLNQTEFYKKRATDEVVSLQMVEHVLSGVERDCLHIVPKAYDDLAVTKSLHNFLQLSHNIDSPEQAQAEFQLMQETESWYSALAEKDKKITIEHLRRYCETTRPPLSPQALSALAKFYRNAPFSESVRSKFDLVMTRFFARETGGDIRQLTHSRDEIIETLNKFYADWSSIPLYATEEDESSIVLAAMKFEEFMEEAEATENVADLLKNNFFSRLKVFKESTHENFFAPLVIATSIESNVRIANHYIRLLTKNRENSDALDQNEKYGPAYEQTISDAVCKTILIANVLEGKFAESELLQVKQAETPAVENGATLEKQNLNKSARIKPAAEKKESGKYSLKINKWLLAATLLAVISSIGLYVWVEYLNEPPKLAENVKVVNLENSSLKEYIKTARLSGDMFYGVVEPKWDSMTKDKQEEFLKKILKVGGEKGFVNVTLLNNQGRTVGYASPEKVETYVP